jgi:preprotein translocase subunit SecA
VVERDDVLERHRSVFYDIRQKILVNSDMQANILTMIDNWAFFKSQTVLKSMPHGIAGGSDGYLGFGRLGAYFDAVETQRILQVRSRQRQHHLLKDTLRRKIRSIIEQGPISGDLLRSQVLRILDDHWARYLQFEQSTRDEMNLYLMDFPRAVARYATQMEERFDSFFYDAGEELLAGLLNFPLLIREAANGAEEEANHG